MVSHPTVLVAKRPDITHQSFTHVAEDGMMRAWDVTEGNRLAATDHKLMLFPLDYHQVTPEKVRGFYPELNGAYALSTDLTRPLLFIPFFGQCLMIDGWHRLYKAAVLGLKDLPMYELTQEEADTAKWLEIAADAAYSAIR